MAESVNEAKPRAAKSGKATAIINIQSSGDDSTAVYLSRDGETLLIQRDQEVEVPAWVPDVLRDATRPVKNAKEATDDKLGLAPRYSFSVIA
ncbi:hypothetical protein IGB42_01921 [Andreprevotia sp. IGB-42]|uniref:hypothetical protein n=1 Tax=Andreprevotia sp. IGB-42 TaxID=2497473 RepID=UPI001357A1EF|nr:hypothetical protein [Andreprevotia sp. IGB-42]KAF0813570.1 hypothetical protein IGB42_01921 [Andreprevotia sp. IGB-42]